MNDHVLSLNDSPKRVNEFLAAWGRQNGGCGPISDGDHSFDELYDCRARLFIQLCKQIAFLENGIPVWCSRVHGDGQTSYPGWFLLGIDTRPGMQISFHIKESYWNEVARFAEVLDRAPHFDGHTTKDVLKRLKYY